ncbi:STAS domain-containing protein [Streptomyces mexicanus]|uniref:STAS domain-containing protein n=1 Tax=Streptomyces mexicanus TaxID=178566 RepID=UPI003640EF0A
MSVETAESGPCVVARVRGGMDYTVQRELRERLTQAIDRAEQALILDMAGVTFCDSAGLNVLLGARREAGRCEVALALACAPGTVRRVLEMTGADQVLRVYATVADAEAALSR